MLMSATLNYGSAPIPVCEHEREHDRRVSERVEGACSKKSFESLQRRMFANVTALSSIWRQLRACPPFRSSSSSRLFEALSTDIDTLIERLPIKAGSAQLCTFQPLKKSHNSPDELRPRSSLPITTKRMTRAFDHSTPLLIPCLTNGESKTRRKVPFRN